jgi:hypothetical protein
MPPLGNSQIRSREHKDQKSPANEYHPGDYSPIKFQRSFKFQRSVGTEQQMLTTKTPTVRIRLEDIDIIQKTLREWMRVRLNKLVPTHSGGSKFVL